MHGGRDVLAALGVVLGTAAVTSIVFRALRQPLVLGYIIAGVMIGPHVPVPLVADPATVETLSELGVVLLMFFLGLEFSLTRLARVGPSVLVTAVVQSSALFWLGFATGRLFGWTTIESLFAGAIIAVSSTTIIAKAFEEARIGGRLKELVIGVLLVEDLIAILLIAILTAVATGAGLSASALALTGARLGGFLVALAAIGLLAVPRAVRALAKRAPPETVTVATVGFCFSIALLAREAGYSVALGSFLAGSLIAESGEGVRIERLVQPLRDVFGAVFFVSVGMMIDPALIVVYWAPVLTLTAVVVLGKIISVAFAAFLVGTGTRTAIRAGMSLAQIGEFSFIVAGVGAALGATGHFMFPVAVAVSSLTTLLTPWLIRASDPFASWVDRRLPRRLQTLGSLYGSWLESIRSTEHASERTARIRRTIRLLAIDALSIIAITVGAALGAARVRTDVLEWLGLGPSLAGGVLAALIALLCAPFVIGIVRVSRRLAREIAEGALPAQRAGMVDLAAAPRHALASGLHLAVLLLVGVPIVAITQPFLHGIHGAELLLLAVVVLGAALWRTAGEVEGHVRAGAQVIVEALTKKPDLAHHDVVPLAAVFAGLGDPVAIELNETSPAVGKTLAELNLRGLTGGTVLAITRGDQAIVMPSSGERLYAGDRLALVGTRDAVAGARELLNASAGDAHSMASVLSATPTP